MRRNGFACGFVCVWMVVFATSAVAESGTLVYLNGKPTPVYFNDGDSFRVIDGELKGSKARLSGYNTLETFGPVHQWSSWSAKELYVLSKQATLNARRGVWHCDSDMKHDTYGRVLWFCKDLAVDQVKKGLAHTLSVDASPGDPDILAAQREAIAAHRGMWAHGVPALVLTSLHSKSEGGGKDGRTYNRLVSTVDGHSEAWEHHDSYSECQKVCHQVPSFDPAVLTALREASKADAAFMQKLDARFKGLTNDEAVRLLEAYGSVVTSDKDPDDVKRIKTEIASLQQKGVIKPKATRDDSCHIYVDFQRRYGSDRAVCLR